MAGKGSVNIKIDGDASNYQKELNESVKATEAAASKIENALKDAAQVLSEGLAKSFKDAQKEQTAAIKSVGEGVNKIVGQNKELISQKDEMGDIYDKLGESAKNAGNKVKAGLADIKAGIDMAVTAAKALGEVAGKGINYNATIEQLKTSFEVMTGSAEKAADVVDRLRIMGAETPFEFTDLASTTQLLMQYGFTADDAIDKMRMLGDVAQGNKEAMTSIAMGYAQMSSAGKVNLQDIKQMINGGFNPLQEISERTGESMDKLYDRISKGKMSVDEITQSLQSATSEGGKFYQSMEKQSQTLNGQLSTMQDNIDTLLGSLSQGLSDGLRDELLPFANNLVGELQTAFDAGGYQGLVDTATDMIPDLLGMMTGELQKGIEGLSRWLPQGATKLMQALPAALRSAATVTPQLTQALFEVATSVVTDLISMLPELMPVFLDGVGSMVKSIANGIGELVEGVFVGIEQAMHQGQTKIAGTWVDNTQVAKYTFELDTDIEPATDEIETAYSNIRAALQTDLLTDDQKTEIEKMIGDDYDAIKAKLMSFGLTDEEAAPIADAVSGAGKTISDAFSKIKVSVDGETLSRWAMEAEGSRLLLRNKLQEAGLTDTEIGQVLAVYDEMLGKVTDGTPSIVQSIYDKLTDGKPDDAQTVEAINKEIDEYVAGLNAAVDKTFETRAGELDITAADYEVKRAELEEWYKTSKASISEMDAGMRSLVTELANAPTSVVKARLDEFVAMEQQLFGLEQKIDILNEKARSAAENAYQVVRSGAKADEATIEQAVNLKFTEFKLDEQAAEDAYNASVEELNELLANKDITQGAYDRRKGALEKERDDAKRAAREAFERDVSEMFGGIAESEGIQQAVQQAGENIDLSHLFTGAAKSLEGFDMGDITGDKLGSSLTEKLADIMQVDPEYLKGLSVQDSMGVLSDWAAEYMKAAERVVDETDNTRLKEIYAGWLETGLLEGTSFAVEDSQGQFEALFGNIDFSGAGEQVAEKLHSEVSEQVENYTPTTGERLPTITTPVRGEFFIDETETPVQEAITNAVEDATSDVETTSDTITEVETTVQPKVNVVEGDVPVQQAVNDAVAEKATGGEPVVIDAPVVVSENTASQAQTAIETMAKSATNSAKSAFDEGGESAGLWMDIGMARGIRNGSSVVVNAAIAVAQAAVSAMKNALGIASPSKVMMELGEFTGEGYAIGLQDSMANAVSVAKRMSGEIVTAADIASSMRVSMPTLTQDIILANEQSDRSVSLYVNGKELGRVMAQDNQLAQNRYNRTIAMGVGKK